MCNLERVPSMARVFVFEMPSGHIAYGAVMLKIPIPSVLPGRVESRCGAVAPESVFITSYSGESEERTPQCAKGPPE